MPFENRRIIVIGGTGFLGQPVVYMLDHFGFPVRIFTRDIHNARKIYGNQFDIMSGDIEDDDSLSRAMKGCYGVHINLKGSFIADNFDKVEHLGTKKVIQAAVKSDIERVSYISGASVSIDRQYYPGTKAKYDAEQKIIKSGLEYAIFRATWFMESLPLFIRDGQATIMGHDTQKIHWLAAEDYARMVTRAFMLEEKLSQIFTVFGPEAYTFKEAFEIYKKIVDPGVKIKKIPIGILKFFASITFSRQLKDILPFMQYFDKSGELGNPAEADKLLGTPQITLENWCNNMKSTTDKQ